MINRTSISISFPGNTDLAGPAIPKIYDGKKDDLFLLGGSRRH
jgi:hypothetical protein